MEAGEEYNGRQEKEIFSAVIHTVHGMAFRGLCIHADSALVTQTRGGSKGILQ
jgi:hypothetical protein